MSETDDYVRADVRGFLDMLATMDRPMIDEVPLEEARASYAMLGQVAEAGVIG